MASAGLDGAARWLLVVGAVSGSLATPSRPAVANDAWLRKADMPTGRLALSVSAVAGKIYAIGGYYGAGSPPAYQVEEYDPATDTWARRASMITPRRRLATAVVDGSIYAIGGNDSLGAPALRTVEVYDAASDRWSERSAMPTARFALTASAVEGKIYAIGGVGGGQVVEEYDPATDTWTRKADAPAVWTAHGAAVVEGTIYLMGGGLPNLRDFPTTVHVYDPATDAWTARAELPEAKGFLGAGALDGKVYAIGGRKDGTLYAGAEGSVWEYDPAADAWTARAPLTTPRWDLRAVAVDGVLFALGGAEYTPPPHSGVATVEAYTPPAQPPEPAE